eukprot:Plantae.Rhodophyta-Rhodochaete_pulchella.ctg23476.p1 GENE.Plantae.Rhodophyta-Rhodochaete_pulchella.ctg23476~~Plantae.Rhodophyta-Rhodochaete_pulchella.ctg23476.p1  ORF type:complete len:338 (+),score=66.44 Plantae.Rhodophyta-Rhodochaete_pulchella.ctg23476:578-1591(+)
MARFDGHLRISLVAIALSLLANFAAAGRFYDQDEHLQAEVTASMMKNTRESPSALKVRGSALSYKYMSTGLDRRTPLAVRTKPNAVLMLGTASIMDDIERYVVQLNMHLTRPFEVVVFTERELKDAMLKRWGDRLVVEYVTCIEPSSTEGPASNKNKLYTRRYKIWRDWLKLRHKKYENILLTDARDMWVQSDPFEFLPGNGTVVFSQELRKTLGGQLHNRAWLQSIDEALGTSHFPKLSGQPIINSGATIGDARGVYKYLTDMVGLYRKAAKTNATILDGAFIDQAFHNILLYSEEHWLNSSLKVLRGTFDSPIFCLGIGTDADYAMEHARSEERV